MEQTLNVYSETAKKINSVITSVQESRTTGKKMKSLDRQFRRNGLNMLITPHDDKQLKNLEFTKTLLEKHAKGIRASGRGTTPGDLVDTEFSRSLSMQKHKENIVSIVSLLTPKKIRRQRKLPVETVVQKTFAGKAGKIIPMHVTPPKKLRTHSVR